MPRALSGNDNFFLKMKVCIFFFFTSLVGTNRLGAERQTRWEHQKVLKEELRLWEVLSFQKFLDNKKNIEYGINILFLILQYLMSQFLSVMWFNLEHTMLTREQRGEEILSLYIFPVGKLEALFISCHPLLFYPPMSGGPVVK